MVREWWGRSPKDNFSPSSIIEDVIINYLAFFPYKILTANISSRKSTQTKLETTRKWYLLLTLLPPLSASSYYNFLLTLCLNNFCIEKVNMFCNENFFSLFVKLCTWFIIVFKTRTHKMRAFLSWPRIPDYAPYIHFPKHIYFLKNILNSF